MRSIWVTTASCHAARAARRTGSREPRPDERRLLGEQVGIGAHDGERRAQLVRHQGDQLDATLVERPQLVDPILRLPLEPDSLDDPREQIGDGPQLVDVGGGELARLLGLDVEDSDHGVVPDERDGEHRGDEAPLVDAADPQETRLGGHVRDDDRLPFGSDVSGDSLAERHTGAADLETVEAVRRRERQLPAVAIEQVERADVGLERIAGPVDDRFQELIPGACGRRQADDPVQELELAELLGRRVKAVLSPVVGALAGGTRVSVDGRHEVHDTEPTRTATRRTLRPGSGPVAKRRASAAPWAA